jgi:hypothetical protein
VDVTLTRLHQLADVTAGLSDVSAVTVPKSPAGLCRLMAFPATSSRRGYYRLSVSIIYAPYWKLRSSKFDRRRQPRRPTARRGNALSKRILAGLLFAAVVIFLALVISGIFR